MRQYFRKSTTHPTEDRVYGERGDEGDETPSSEESGEDYVEGRKLRRRIRKAFKVAVRRIDKEGKMTEKEKKERVKMMEE